jgi:hypothetical protein
MNIPIPATVHTLNDFVFRSADRMRIAWAQGIASLKV